MRMLRRGQKGFTLIELLIVVAIIGVLAAVVIPNVGRFLGRGEDEARRTEFHNVSSAVIALMVDNAISEIPGAVVYAPSATNAVNMMSYSVGPPTAGFPDNATLPATKNTKDGTTVYTLGGYTLYGHQIAYDSTVPPDGTLDAVKLVNYVTMDRTKYYYTSEKDGTVRQWKSADTTATGTEYKY